jgi:hypothetical protein
MSAPWSSSTIWSVFSSAALAAEVGVAAAAEAVGDLRPELQLVGHGAGGERLHIRVHGIELDAFHALLTMRATALHPPPPTPMTLMRVPPRASSSISYLRSFMVASNSSRFNS